MGKLHTRGGAAITPVSASPRAVWALTQSSSKPGLHESSVPTGRGVADRAVSSANISPFGFGFPVCPRLSFLPFPAAGMAYLDPGAVLVLYSLPGLCFCLLPGLVLSFTHVPQLGNFSTCSPSQSVQRLSGWKISTGG